MRPFLVSILLFALPLPLYAVPAPNVVEVSSHRTADTPPADRTLGFIVETDGFLITSYQELVDPAKGTLHPSFKVTVSNKDKTYPARVIGLEPTLNFAVLQIDAPEEVFEASVISRDRSIVPGQGLYAATQARDPEKEQAMGRLLALNSLECYQESLTQTMFSSEMIIDERSIGSPVFNGKGDVVALYTGYEPPDNPEDDTHVDDDPITHLLPIFLAFNIYESIKQRRSLASPWTGFSVRPLTRAEEAQFPVADGRYQGGIAFEYIWENSPAEAMGLQTDDILLRFAHNPISSPADFQKWLYMYGVGRKVDLYVLRDGEILVKEYTIEERPKWAVPK